ncbi:hypothetical protein M8R21_44185 [Klebsiella sp. T2.Ur]|nr:hypothetical protein [Klebsiella sp. T2.Ur]
MVRLRQNGQAPTDFNLHGFDEWSNNDLLKRLDLVKELIERIEDIGLPHNHPWNGVKRESVLPGELDRLIPKINTLLHKAHDFQSTLVAIAARVGITLKPVLFNEADKVVDIANLINKAPELEEVALVNPVWSNSLYEIKSLIEQGEIYTKNFKEIKNLINEDQFDRPLLEFRDELQTVPEDLFPSAFAAARTLLQLLPQIQITIASLTTELGTESQYRSSQEIKNLIELSGRVADAPDASPQAFVASVWEHGVEQARETGQFDR